MTDKIFPKKFYTLEPKNKKREISSEALILRRRYQHIDLSWALCYNALVAYTCTIFTIIRHLVIGSPAICHDGGSRADMTSNHCNQHRGGSSNAKPRERMIRITFCRSKQPPSAPSHMSFTTTFPWVMKASSASTVIKNRKNLNKKERRELEQDIELLSEKYRNIELELNSMKCKCMLINPSTKNYEPSI
jgi:hypothetical protein